jgi:hypothetical protein
VVGKFDADDQGQQEIIAAAEVSGGTVANFTELGEHLTEEQLGRIK